MIGEKERFYVDRETGERIRQVEEGSEQCRLGWRRCLGTEFQSTGA